MVFFYIHGWRILSSMTKASSPNPDAALFGAIFRDLRVRRGWTIRKAAQRLGIHPTHLGVVEAGGNMPSIELLLEVADTFNIDASTIMRAVEEGRKELRAEAVSPATPSTSAGE